MARDSLDDYGKKRDFGRTPEPRAGRRRTGTGDDAGADLPAFVVHRHEARRLHYDLRLERPDGTALASFAVPKGFSYEPKDKHLAVRTEDHPIEYLDFAGVIPKGEYGAGTMQVWDRGTFEIVKAPDLDAALAAGEIKIVLHGKRVRGEWHLVHTKPKADGDDRQWLLFKARDRYAAVASEKFHGVTVDLSAAERAAPPGRFAPMRSANDGPSEPFTSTGWLFELDFEGRRAWFEKSEQVGDGAPTTRWRTAGRRAGPLPNDALTRGLERVRARDVVLDGVLVATDDGGRPSRALLDERLAARGGRGDGLAYYVFDVLHFDGLDVRGLPLEQRKRLLRTIVPAAGAAGGGALLFVDHVATSGVALAQVVRDAGLRGLVAKRADSRYVGKAADAWQRLVVDVESSDGSLAESVHDALARTAAARPRGPAIKVSNPDKVYWPEDGHTKRDLIDYYDAIADVLLPHLAERPIHLFRHPDGIAGKAFYQRNLREHAPDWLETLVVERQHGEAYEHVLCPDRRTLLFLINLGSIDLHPWMSRVDSLDSPDWFVLDLDPKSAPFEHVVRIARELGKLLRGIGMRPYLKTSGSTGLHVYVPLVPGYDYDQARMFAEAVARVVARDLADIATVERNPANRGGRVYVDFGQNRRGQTVVPPYVVRPVPGASVSTPLDWDELSRSDLAMRDFDLKNVPERVERVGDLFAPVLTDGQPLEAALAALQEQLGGG